jgi:hypothetical protein
MSADNGYIVSKLHDQDEYGVFYESGSADYPPEAYSFNNALEVYTDPVAAVIAAHERNRRNTTEYGVYVNGAVIKDCLPYLSRANKEK